VSLQSTGPTSLVTETYESLPQNDLLPMELPLMLSQVGSPAKMLAVQENKQALLTAHAADSGLKSSALLANWHRDSSSWRTSQTCLLAQVSGQGDGLAEFLETWPPAGIMRNGQIFQRPSLALRSVENVSGLLPTPRKTMWNKCWKRRKPQGNLEEVLGDAGLTGWINPLFVEKLMGFPETHTELPPSETP